MCSQAAERVAADGVLVHGGLPEGGKRREALGACPNARPGHGRCLRRGVSPLFRASRKLNAAQISLQHLLSTHATHDELQPFVREHLFVSPRGNVGASIGVDRDKPIPIIAHRFM